MAKRRPPPPSEDSQDGFLLDKPVQRNAANARERARMRVLSRAFCRLKTSLPWVPPDTKLSKLDTLRLAATYIAHLRKVLKEEEEKGEEPIGAKKIPHPVAFSWPFTVNNNKNSCSSSTPTKPSTEVHKEYNFYPSSDSAPSPLQPNYPPCQYMNFHTAPDGLEDMF